MHGKEFVYRALKGKSTQKYLTYSIKVKIWYEAEMKFPAYWDMEISWNIKRKLSNSLGNVKTNFSHAYYQKWNL